MLKKRKAQFRMSITFVIGILFFLMHALYVSQALAQDIAAFCDESYSQNIECPKDLCALDYFAIGESRAYIMRCVPKPCLQIEADKCPLDKCQLLKGCTGEDVCFAIIDHDPPVCGSLAYEGQAAPCCQGFVKRCGVEFFDGSCDMEGKYTVDAIPICLPCGNGICNQFENRCNCPEDCSSREN